MSSSRRDNEARSDVSLILRTSLQGRAGVSPWESEQKLQHLPTLTWQGRSGLPRGTGQMEQGAGDTCPRHQCVLVCCRTVPSRAALIDSMGRSQLQPRRAWRTSHPCPELSSFSINIVPKLFSRKFIPQLTVLPGWSSVKWEKHTETSSTSLDFLFGLWEFKKWILWLCCWVSTGWMWFLTVISVVKLCTDLWCLMCQSIKACCYARNDAMALCGLLGIAKMGQKYQEKV